MNKVLVVVPVYNVEKFLKRCLDSISNQTYKNIKCILVDDGSTDSSGFICDDYAKKDNRIISLHKKNGGLSSARNFALDYHSKNRSDDEKYLMFVDSDDWLAENAIEKLVNEMIFSDSDMICFNYIAVYKNNRYSFMNTTKNCNYTTIQVKEKLLYDYWLNSVWDKFYKICIFDSLRFCENINFEDSEIMPKILLKTNKIYCIKDYLYYYTRYNTNSILNNYIDSKNFLGIYYGWKSHLETAKILKINDLINYCNKKLYTFALKSFVLNTLDNNLSVENRTELLSYLKRNVNGNINSKIMYVLCIKYSFFCKIYAYIIVAFNKIKLFFRNKSVIYYLWMKYKNSK